MGEYQSDKKICTIGGNTVHNVYWVCTKNE